MIAMLEGSEAWNNSAHIPEVDAIIGRILAESAAFRAGWATSELDLCYGPGARHRLDLFHPAGQARGLLVFVHGGYWHMNFTQADWAILARGALVRGWACALPTYTLAPEARIGEMVREVAAAVRHAAGLVGGPVIVTGNSAGGHLSARMGCADVDVPVARVVPISPLAELAPLATAEMNATLGLDADEIAAESPARKGLRTGCSAHVWVGAEERPGLLWQGRVLAEAWACPWTVEPGRHHFDVIDGLADGNSALMRACLDGF